MAGDLGAASHTGIVARLCGDAHLLNFRLLASPERHLAFDINDFDETLPCPWECDVKRLAASLVIAGSGNRFSVRQRGSAVRGAVRAYRESMRDFAGTGNLDVGYTQADADRLREDQSGGLDSGDRERVSHALAAARTRDNLQAFTKLTRDIDGRRRITPEPPLIVPLDDLLPDSERDVLERQLRLLIERYGQNLPSDRRHLFGQFRLVDIARKVVGVGSVDTRCGHVAGTQRLRRRGEDHGLNVLTDGLPGLAALVHPRAVGRSPGPATAPGTSPLSWSSGP